MPKIIPADLRKYIEKNFSSGRLVCLSGAGISYESGIPTFRGKGGLWEKYDPAVYANVQGLTRLFKERPQRLIDFLRDFYTVLLEAAPNPAHLALARLEKEGILKCLITQNIDGLHQQAGSRNVIELHGDAFRTRCTGCIASGELGREKIKEMLRLLAGGQNSRQKTLRILSSYFPRCRKCQGRQRIDIVLFGESLPEDEMARAYKQLAGCGVLLLVGTSLVVYPAASLPLYAKEKGAELIEINSQPTAFSEVCDWKIRSEAGPALAEILKILGYA